MIVDSSALAAILFDEPDADLYKRALAQESSAKISTATLVEIGIVIDQRSGIAGGRRLDQLVDAYQLQPVPLSSEQAAIARRAYREYGRRGKHPAKLNLGDCFSYALASATGEPLLFKGDDFRHTDVRPALPRS